MGDLTIQFMIHIIFQMVWHNWIPEFATWCSLDEREHKMSRIVYQAAHEYIPDVSLREEGYIPIHEGDELVMDFPTDMSTFKGTIEEPSGWLQGTNTTKALKGTFPGTMVHFVRQESVPTPPPRATPTPTPRTRTTSARNDIGTASNDSGYGSPGQYK